MIPKTILGNVTGNGALLAKNAIAKHINNLESQAASPVPTAPFIAKLNKEHSLVPDDQLGALTSDVEKLRTQEVGSISRAGNLSMRADLGMRQAKSTIVKLITEVKELAAGHQDATSPATK